MITIDVTMINILIFFRVFFLNVWLNVDSCVNVDVLFPATSDHNLSMHIAGLCLSISSCLWARLSISLMALTTSCVIPAIHSWKEERCKYIGSCQSGMLHCGKAISVKGRLWNERLHCFPFHCPMKVKLNQEIRTVEDMDDWHRMGSNTSRTE